MTEDHEPLEVVDQGEESASFRSGADSAPSNVTDLPLRRTYLDACRDQGVFQKDEETRAELFETRGEIAAKRTEMHIESGRLNGKAKFSLVPSAEPKAPTLTHAEELEAREQEVMKRVAGIMQLYANAGMGDCHFPLLMHLVCKAPIKLAECEGLFEAVLSDVGRGSRQQPALTDREAHERRRLGLDHEEA
ncbi:hypothetical protein NGM99_12640 [Mesorhizobium sp. RP14(2022)]|uniref:Uncharacterized protein n=1 Tax=Mesorhizobium liriopis TaxID=2953882 RepID=A0ABT1C9I3_9HYPH|nr:hypothetical protein [Mesorhizobium liriopis]MCO6050631.1 hypothetical protein [Mesorhizobium liriopis]